jgi:drug/metabolite transporter (DMT)-like permease
MARAQVLLAAVCFGTTGTAQALGPGASPVTVGAVRIALGALMLLLAARWAGRAQAGPWARGPVLAAALGVAAYQLCFFAAVKDTGVAALAYLLFARGLRHLPARDVATLTLGEPVTAAALGAVVLGERPGAAAVAGIALIVAGLAVLAAPRRQPVPRPAEAPA